MGHRKRVRHYHEPGHLHELTFSCYRRLPLLTNDDWRQRLSHAIDQANADWAIELAAFVFMPEHVHLLVYPTGPKPSLHRYLAAIKQPFSKEIKGLLTTNNSKLLVRLTVQERPGKWCFRFWQEGPGFDRNLYSPEATSASIDYMHNNPVRRGLCRRAVDWRWSSARFYLGNPPGQQDEAVPYIHGLRAGAIE